MTTIAIGNRTVGDGEPCYVVAEISGNHNQSFERAVEIVHAAKEAGADAIKSQTYTPDTLTIRSDRHWFQVPSTTPWGGRTLYELYGEAYTPWEWQPQLQELAHKLDMGFFSSPFDATAVDFLEGMGVEAYKVASFELVDVALLERIARAGKPTIISTGMGSLAEIELAVRTFRTNGCHDLALLKCTSAYPASPAHMNLRTIPHLASTFGVVVGLSDHTLGESVPIAAVAVGATIVEKHFTLSRADGGPDSAFSLEPAELTRMVRAIREAEEALGRVSYDRTPDEAHSLVFRRSLFVVKDVRKGETFTHENIRSIRPGYGLSPQYLVNVLGSHAACDVPRGTPLVWDLLGGKGVL